MSTPEGVTRTPQVFCPRCNHQLNALGTPDGLPGDRGPQEGDVSICIECGQLLIIQADLTMRLPTQEEIDNAVDDPKIYDLVEQWMDFDNARRFDAQA